MLGRRGTLRFVALLPMLAAMAAQPAAAGVGASLTGQDGRILQVNLPASVDSTTASTVQAGHRNWFFILRNDSGSTVTNPTISVNSGYSPTLFDSNCSATTLSSFPFVTSQATLASGQGLNSGLCSSIPVSFTAGFDSARAVTPLQIPVGGGRQSVTVTMTLTDARYAASNVVKVTVLADDLPGETVACDTASAPPPNGSLQCASNRVNWVLNDQPLGVPMRFVVSVNVPNTSTQPILHKPGVWTLAAPAGSITVVGPTNRVSIADPTLDGATPGAGIATFSIAETAFNWATDLTDNYWVAYTPFFSSCNQDTEGDQNQGGNSQGC